MEDRREKRKHPRYALSCLALVERLDAPIDPSAEMSVTARMVDISVAGACLELRELLQANERVRLVVDDDSLSFGLNCVAVIRWSRKVTGGYRAGLEFTNAHKFAPGTWEKSQCEGAGPHPNPS